MAEDMILEVKKAVTMEINAKINNEVVPELICEFLKGPWTEVMKIIGLRDDCMGKGWNEALKLVEDLVWSVQPKKVVKERRRLLALLPEILQALQNGLTLIYYGQQEIDAFFTKLEKLHLVCVRNEGLVEIGNRSAILGTNKERNYTCDLNDELLGQIINHSGKHEAFQADISNPQLQKSPFFETVRSMPLGTWVEFKHFDTSKRGKLAWKCDFTGEFTFLDRCFKVVADVGMRDLIRQLEIGKAQIVNDVAFIDRAMDVIVNGMKQTVSRGNNWAQVTQ